jgi:putative endonuclease
MKFVYVLQNLTDTAHFYTGITNDLQARLSARNSGSVTHTAKYRP